MQKESDVLTRTLSNQQQEENELYKSEEALFATFFLEGMEFGIDVKYIREAIVYRDKIMQIPTSIDIVDGLINLRGSIIPIVNMRSRFGLEQKVSTLDNHYAIILYKNHCIGLCFDDISEVIRVKQKEISLVEENSSDAYSCNSGILSLENGKRIVQIIDPQILFKNCDLPLIDNDSNITEKTFVEIKKNITFLINDQEYALDVNEIREIIKVPQIHQRIEVEEFIKGVISFREDLITIVDLRKYLGLPAIKTNEHSRIIIINGEVPCGLLVDSIKEIIHYQKDKCLDFPDFSGVQEKEAFFGVISISEERNILIINSNKLFQNETKKQIMHNIKLHHNEDEFKGTKNENNEVLNASDDRVYITFKLGETLAIDINLFQEIINYSKNIVPLPGSENYFEGILNLRGTSVPVINLRKFYEMDNYKNILESKIIILKIKDTVFGIVVDEIIEILKTFRTKLTEVPFMFSKQSQNKIESHISETFKFDGKDGNKKVFMIFNAESFIKSLENNQENVFNQTEKDREECNTKEKNLETDKV